jgi:peptidoglycan/LPS O-acetylase OafA/YrhL
MIDSPLVQSPGRVALADVSQTRANNFDFFRFLFAALVIFSHSFYLAGVSGAEPIDRLSHGQTSFGDISVDCFFLISGFLITKSWLNSKSVIDYLKRRVLRIYPGYVGAMLVTLFVFGMAGAANKTAYLHGIRPLHLLWDLVQLHRPPDLLAFLHNPIPHELNGSLWTIAIEFQCYLGVIVLGWLGWLRRPNFVLALFICFLIVQTSLADNVPVLHRLALHLPLFVQFKLHLIVCFVAGMLMLLFASRIVYSSRLFLAAVGAVCISLFAGGWILCFPICGAYALFYAAFNPRLKAQNWGRRGDISYGTYLYAWPIQQLLIAWQGTPLNPYLLAVEAAALTFACAMVSWFSIEKPCLKLKGSSRSH